jgi:transposase
LNGIVWLLRAGAPRRDLPNRYGPYTTAYKRAVRSAYLLQNLKRRTVMLADKGYDADCDTRCDHGAGSYRQHHQQIQRKVRHPFRKKLYRQRNLIERFFNKLKQYRRIAARYDKLGATFFTSKQLAAVRIWLRSIESAA